MEKLLYLQNIRSLGANFDELNIELENLNIKPQFLIVTETWLREYSNLNIFCQDRWKSIETCNQKSERGGGVAVLSTEQNYITTIKKTSHQNLQILTVKANIPKWKKILITVIYKAPKMNAFEFVDTLMNHLFEIQEESNTKHIVCGDFNIDIAGESDRKQNLLQNLQALGFELANNPKDFTRVSQSSQSTIDLVFSNFTVQTLVHNSSASDHFGVIIEARSISTKKDSEKKSFISRNWKKLEKLETKLLLNNKIREKFEIDPFPKNILTSMETLENLLRLLEKVLEEIIPQKNIKPQSEGKRWITNEVKNQCSKKIKLWKKFLDDKSEETKEKFRRQRNKCKELVRRSKKEFYSKIFCKENDKNNKKFFQFIKNLTNEKSLGLNHDPSKDISATMLNDFFVEIGPNLAKKFKNNFEISSIPKNEKSLFLSKTDKLEVFNELKHLNNKKSLDTFGLSNFFLKIVSPTISEQLSQIFNKCIEEECFPDLLKIGVVIPIHKEGPKNEAGNYRPISLLPVVGKLFEKLLHKRILDFLIKHKVLSGRQLGFLSKRSMVDAIIETFEALLERKQQHKPFQCTLLDLSKAFDTVDHQLLLAKCERYGLRGKVGRLLCSFLSNRKQFVQFSDNSSNMRDITHGVPQGSVLGPLLFLLYINDLPTIVKNCEITLFADDTKIFGDYNENSHLVELNKISEWMKNNKPTLNEAKTQFMLVGKKAEQSDYLTWNNT